MCALFKPENLRAGVVKGLMIMKISTCVYCFSYGSSLRNYACILYYLSLRRRCVHAADRSGVFQPGSICFGVGEWNERNSECVNGPIHMEYIPTATLSPPKMTYIKMGSDESHFNVSF